MAITYITGVSGSGKSYFSTYTIYKMFKNDFRKANTFMQWFNYYISPIKPKKLFTHAYVNIDNFNYDFHPNLKPFTYDALRKDLAKLHRYKVKESCSDKDLIKEAKKLGLYDCLIVFDEVQDHFKKPVDDVIVWWLTYHRHLEQELHLMTQDLGQIPSDYFRNTTHFYKMPSPALALFKNRFTVSYYSCKGMTAKCREKSFTIPFLNEVGELYTSGAKQDRESVVKKFFWIFPLMALFMYMAYEYFKYISKEESDKASGIQREEVVQEEHRGEPQTEEIKQEIQEYEAKEAILQNDTKKKDFEKEEILKLVTIKCIKEVCLYDNKEFPMDLIMYIINNYKIEYTYINEITYTYTEYTFLLDERILSMLDTLKQKKEKRKKSTIPQSQISLFGK